MVGDLDLPAAGAFDPAGGILTVTVTTLPETWPAALREYLASRFGLPLEIVPLGGMGGGAVWRVRFARAAVIVKRSASPVETYVYGTLSDVFAAQGVSIPAMYWSAQEAGAGDFWLVMEDIPRALPSARRGADADVMALLRNLHQLPRERVSLPPGAYAPAWPEEMTDAALSLFPDEQRKRLAGLLEAVRAAALPLFAPDCLISGDPNPLNWGLRDDGAVVLFDWERFTFGTPALDLAIVVPGLGQRNDYVSIAERYLGHGVTVAGAGELAGQIQAAKVWSVVEFLSQVAQGTVRPGFSVSALIDQVSRWLYDERDVA